VRVQITSQALDERGVLNDRCDESHGSTIAQAGSARLAPPR
jgi:hypothetical protein